MELPQDKLEAGRLYFVGVSLVDSEGYASPLNRVGPFNAPVPQEDIVVTPTGAAGVLVPIFIVIAVLGSALGYYMYRNRRLARNFAAYASRYNAASGTTILNTVSRFHIQIHNIKIVRKEGRKFSILDRVFFKKQDSYFFPPCEMNVRKKCVNYVKMKQIVECLEVFCQPPP